MGFNIDNEGKVYCKPAYKCGICGKEYTAVQDRMNCEMACIKMQKEEEKRIAEEKKAAEYEVRVAEVNAAFEKAYKLRDKLAADFGDYHYQNLFANLDDMLDKIFNF